MLQAAWLWLRHQPQSALARWFHARLPGMVGKAARKRLIVALARKLFVALWKFTSAGVVIEGGHDILRLTRHKPKFRTPLICRGLISLGRSGSAADGLLGVKKAEAKNGPASRARAAESGIKVQSPTARRPNVRLIRRNARSANGLEPRIERQTPKDVPPSQTQLLTGQTPM